MSGMEKERIRIGGLVKQSLVDWDGVLSAVVFTKGCNFRCGYCHNPALVVPALMRERPDVAESEVFDYLARRRGWLDGWWLRAASLRCTPDSPLFWRG